MSDELRAAIHALQGGDDARVRSAFAEITDIARSEPGDCAAGLSRALLDERSAGTLHTPRLLTLLGLTREPAPECVPLCLELLRGLGTNPSSLPGDAALGAAAIVARTRPRALLPDVAAMVSGSQAAQEMDRQTAQALPLLLAISSEFLREAPDHAVTDMARWLWHDCAVLDLMTLTDFVAAQVEQSGADDPIVGLLADLVERVPASEDQKSYAGQRLQEAGVGAAVIEQLQAAWRAIRVAPPDPAAEPHAFADPESPLPEPRVDEWLVSFAEGDQQGIEVVRASIEEMFQEERLPSLAWWLAVTVDSLPPPRRRTEIGWALDLIGTAVRDAKQLVPGSVLQRWLDTPQLLTAIQTKYALDLLSRQQPGVVVQRYLHRAVAASDVRHAKMLMGESWRALAAAEPAAVLAVASRWIEAGFGQSDFLELLIDVLNECDVTAAARELLDQLRHHAREDE